MSNLEELLIQWEGPYDLPEFVRNTNSTLKEKYHKPGVYIWIDELPNKKYRLSYVGRAGGKPSLWERQVQHYGFMIGGLYTIPGEFRKSGITWIPDRSKKEIADICLSKEQFLGIVEDGFRYANACSVYLWPTTSKANVNLIERNLLYDLKPTGTVWGTLSEPPTRLKIRHRNPHWLFPEIRKQIKNDELFVSGC